MFRGLHNRDAGSRRVCERETSLNPGGRLEKRISVGDVDLLSLIDVRPDVRGGKPAFVGTRITVYDVLEYLASGMTTGEIVADFPELTTDHVRAPWPSLRCGSIGSPLRSEPPFDQNLSHMLFSPTSIYSSSD